MEEHVRVILVLFVRIDLFRRVSIGNHDNLIARLFLSNERDFLPCLGQLPGFDTQLTAYRFGDVLGQHIREFSGRLRPAEDEQVVIGRDRHRGLLDVFFDGVDVSLELQVPVFIIAVDRFTAVDDVVRQVRVPGVLNVGKCQFPGYLQPGAFPGDSSHGEPG